MTLRGGGFAKTSEYRYMGDGELAKLSYNFAVAEKPYSHFLFLLFTEY